ISSGDHERRASDSHRWEGAAKGSALTHLLLSLAAAHPLFAPLPAHLSALLPRTRRAFHRADGRAYWPSSYVVSRPDDAHFTAVHPHAIRSSPGEHVPSPVSRV